MSKTLSDIADDIIAKMSQEEMKIAAKAGVMLTLQMASRGLTIIKEALENGK